MKYTDLFRLERPKRVSVLITLLLASASSNAAEFEVTVLDRHGEPVPDVAVYIQSNGDDELRAAAALAVMQQLDYQFDPELLVVQTGTRVQFPNHDVVAHHVYSFSKPNNFVLPMFKGGMRPQVEFDHAGVVTVGCNLHDHMVGYILVVDSDVFGKTDHDGKVHLETDNPHGLTVNIWNPSLKLEIETLSQAVNAGRSARLTFLLTEELRSQRNDETEALSWRENRIR